MHESLSTTHILPQHNQEQLNNNNNNKQLTANGTQSPLAALTTTSSGDDRLLTANADEGHFSELAHYRNNYRHAHHHHHAHRQHHCHDNRAFQYHNNSKNSKNLDDDDALDVIIIDPNDTRAKGLMGPGCFKLLPPKLYNGGGAKLFDKRKPHLCKHDMRMRHNATQTTDANLEYWVKIDAEEEPQCKCVFHQKQSVNSNKHCKQRNICCGKYYERCQHHHHHHYHHHHHNKRQEKLQQNKLPVSTTPTTTKSSLESNRRLQQIAIEIDAATTTTQTEDIGSTATSNFTYKLATRNSAPPIILSNLRRMSLQSNATACTDELSNDGDEEEIDVVGDEDDDQQALAADKLALTLRRRKSQRHRRHTSEPQTNACINIQRKQYEVNYDCSSCSSCSCCDLCQQQRSSSCSSLELDVEKPQLTVLADCHYCSMHSNTSDEEAVTLRKQHDMQRAESFCSCNSERSCCSCCSCPQKENEEVSASTATPQMLTAREFSEDEQMSRTLTPLSGDTAASTPIAEDSEQQTLKSQFSCAPASLDDASESAEFFSLSSCAPAPLTPVHKSCRHYHQHCHQSRAEKTSQTMDAHL